MRGSILLFSFLVCTANLQAQKQLPDVQVRTMAGQSFAIQDILEEGQPVILSFWASWCKPCHRELNAFQDNLGQWQERFGVKVVAVTIDTRRQLARAKSIAATQGWDFLFLSDQENTLKNALNFPAIPQTYLVQPDGTILFESSGYVTGAEKKIEEKLVEMTNG
ncbi:MAG: TlpA family protein disulfide reductase [Saprospiraceae bacterium]|nr:TlpA family protein disulfide reductase [Saprospiraceae bacterium]